MPYRPGKNIKIGYNMFRRQTISLQCCQNGFKIVTVNHHDSGIFGTSQDNMLCINRDTQTIFNAVGRRSDPLVQPGGRQVVAKNTSILAGENSKDCIDLKTSQSGFVVCITGPP